MPIPMADREILLSKVVRNVGLSGWILESSQELFTRIRKCMLDQEPGSGGSSFDLSGAGRLQQNRNTDQDERKEMEGEEK